MGAWGFDRIAGVFLTLHGDDPARMLWISDAQPILRLQSQTTPWARQDQPGRVWPRLLRGLSFVALRLCRWVSQKKAPPVERG
jgi:hypothetical protein